MERRSQPSSSRKNVSSDPRQVQPANVTVSLGKLSLRTRLEAYYAQVAPDIIADKPAWKERFVQIYAKFGGTQAGEHKLAMKLHRKYGTSVRLQLAIPSSLVAGDQHKQRAGVSASSTVRDESWYDLRPDECNSGNLDFTCGTFDPVATLLRAPQSKVELANPFVPNCPRLDRVDKFAEHLPAEDPLRKEPILRKTTIANHNNNNKANDSRNATTAARKRQQGPFRAVASNYETGPFATLHRLMHQRVRVLVRYVNGIRGTVTGNLMTYDKHMNMILCNVEEVYSPRYAEPDADNRVSNMEQELARRRNALRECSGRIETSCPNSAKKDGTQEVNKNDPMIANQPNPSSSSSSNNNTTTKWHVRVREMKQMMLRGDSVVLVYKANEERSCWPQTNRSPTQSIYTKSNTKTVPPNERIGSPGSLAYAIKQSQRQRDAMHAADNGSASHGAAPAATDP